MRIALVCLLVAFGLSGQEQKTSSDVKELIKAATQALEKNQLHEAAEAFQQALDVNPSSILAHEGLGTALAKEIISGNTRPSEDSDMVDRAENHLRQASELAPSNAKPLIQFSELERVLAEYALQRPEKEARYAKAQEMLKRAIGIESSRPDLYLQLAVLERDEFGPPIQKAKLQAGKSNGPLADVDFRRELQQQYGPLMDDAISNARTAAELDGHLTKPLLLMARILRERALLRDTQQDYSVDMHSADDWQRQFLAAGGHLDASDTNAR